MCLKQRYGCIEYVPHLNKLLHTSFHLITYIDRSTLLARFEHMNIITFFKFYIQIIFIWVYWQHPKCFSLKIIIKCTNGFILSLCSSCSYYHWSSFKKILKSKFWITSRECIKMEKLVNLIIGIMRPTEYSKI